MGEKKERTLCHVHSTPTTSMVHFLKGKGGIGKREGIEEIATGDRDTRGKKNNIFRHPKGVCTAVRL